MDALRRQLQDAGWVQALLEGTTEGVVLVDLEGRVVRANAVAAALFGRAPEELEGRSVLEARCERAGGTADPLDRPRRLVERGEPFDDFVCTFLRRPRGRALLRSSGRPLRGPDGARVGSVIRFLDVTRRREAEEAAAAAEASLRAFLERSPDAAVIHRGGRLLYVNPAVTRFLGYDDASKLIGSDIDALTAPEDRPAVRERVEQMEHRSEPVPLREERFLRADGGTFDAEVFALPVFFEGRPAILAFGHDLAPRRKAEAERQALLESQTRLREDAQRRAAELRGILANLTSGLFVCDTEGRITLSNRAAAQILGQPGAEDLQRDMGEVAALLDLRTVDGTPVGGEGLALARALQGETVLQEERVVRHGASGRDRYVRVSAAPIRDDRGEVVSAVAVFRDVTEVIEFDRLKDQFIRVVAHELKTPLTVLKGYAELLERTPEDQPASRAALGAVVRGADRIDRIVQDMLELSQILTGTLALEPTEVDLSELVTRVVRRLAPGLSRHRIHVQTVPAPVRADPARIEQVLMRVLDNAVRYSPAGGEVRLQVRRENDTVEVSVQDQGVGIPEDKHVRVFQRFYRAHTDTPHDYGGLGVGLFLSREIIARHGGEMWFESREGVGSTFHFRLPARSSTDAG